ncbi:P22 phage major capsid protein family protein [Clostridium pasteurianum]|uniref:p22 coat protein-gene protein 5 n=1 Tax=Clostridium pasteurianum BC1 TaxID=86416 RepID=R4KA28_CLOPA|nr:P22 phage major capsid protein family protein [Clostridium pasteurianum]AGK97404.1 P22 coat protein - gene protein 5 [Clostridium pasteurianum BC1]
MANNFLTAQMIAREALLRLQSNFVMAGLVFTDYSSEFKELGDTIQVKKPATFIADEFGGTVNLQDVGESSVLVKLDKIADVSVEVGSKELSLNIQDFGAQILDGATLAIAEKVDQDLCGLYKDIPYFSGVGGTTPAAVTDIANAMLVMNKNRAPMASRNAVWDPNAQAKLVSQDFLVNANKSGSTDALRNASMGRIMGFDNYMDQNVKTHLAGTYTSLTDVKAAGTKGTAAVTLTSTAGTSTGTIKQGDVFTINGNQYVAKADATAVTGVISNLPIYPKLPSDADVVAVPVTFGKSHVASLAFHQNALGLVSRPLEPPMGGATSYVATSPNGLSLRVTMGYDMTTKRNMISIDTLYGVSTLYPELATRILG